MNKRIIILILLWAVVVLWMGVIFSFSMENAEQSAASSDSVLEKVLRVLDKNFDTYTAERQEQLLEQYSRLIRKTAHFCIYAALGFFTANAFTYQGMKRRNTVLYSFLIGVIYAVSDEIHQYFVPGRACQFADVLIDSAGATFGIAVSILLVMLIRKRQSFFIQ